MDDPFHYALNLMKKILFGGNNLCDFRWNRFKFKEANKYFRNLVGYLLCSKVNNPASDGKIPAWKFGNFLKFSGQNILENEMTPEAYSESCEKNLRRSVLQK